MSALTPLKLDEPLRKLLWDAPNLGATLEAPNSLLAKPLGASEQASTDLPAVGTSAKRDGQHLLRLQRDTLFVLVEEGADASGQLDDAYDQSHAWMLLNIQGEFAPDLMERLCMLDVNGPGFPVSHVTRTLIDHMGVIVWHRGTNQFALFVATSYALSLAERVQQCAEDLATLAQSRAQPAAQRPSK